MARTGKRMYSGRNEREFEPQEEVEWSPIVRRKWFGPTGLRGKNVMGSLVQNSWEWKMKRGERTSDPKRRQDEKANEGS